MASEDYPATSLSQAQSLNIDDANILHEIINGASDETVDVDEGIVPTVRKALADNFYFKSPVDWVENDYVTEFNQLALYSDGTLWTSPTARTTNPILMGTTPYGDALWEISPYSKLYTVATSLNVSISEVIYATDTTTELDNVVYIYDLENEVVYSKPSDVGSGEYIVSVAGAVLTTDLNSYPLVKLVYSIKVNVPSTSADYGEEGYVAADSSYIYIYTGDGVTHSWVRSSASSW